MCAVHLGGCDPQLASNVFVDNELFPENPRYLDLLNPPTNGFTHLVVQDPRGFHEVGSSQVQWFEQFEDGSVPAIGMCFTGPTVSPG